MDAEDRRHSKPQSSPRLNRLVARVEEDSDVVALLLFGSAARGEAGPYSDLDLCLVLRPGPRERDGHKRLEYLGEFDFDIHIFKQLPLYVRTRVLKEGEVIHCKDEPLFYDIAYRHAREYEDFKYIYREYLSAVLDG